MYMRHAVIGYKDSFVDAGTIAHGSAAQAIEGRHYYRSMRVHKEAFDALAQRRIKDITNNYGNVNQALLNF